MPRVGMNVSEKEEASAAELAERAETRGYDSVWVPEVWGDDAFVTLGNIAARTDAIDVGTAVVNVYTRSPAALAMAAASITEQYGNRVLLGIGTSSPVLIEGLHGIGFDAPVRRTHETIELIKRYTSGDDQRVEYDGEIFTVSGFRPLDGDVEVYNAALGSANRRATGRVADGWMPQNVPFPELSAQFETIAAAARDADRDPDAITVSPVIATAVSDDGESARELTRGDVAYLTGSTDGYRNAAATMFPEEAQAVADAWAAREHGKAASLVTDEMLDALTVSGTPESARDAVRDLLDNPVIDRPVLRISARADAETAKRTIDELAPDAF